MRPSSAATAWIPSPQSIKLSSQHTKASSPQEYNFDAILTGSDNKPVYNKVARGHVCAAMDGYNSVVFAYGQTASGKTFTLVSVNSESRFELFFFLFFSISFNFIRIVCEFHFMFFFFICSPRWTLVRSLL